MSDVCYQFWVIIEGARGSRGLVGASKQGGPPGIVGLFGVLWS